MSTSFSRIFALVCAGLILAAVSIGGSSCKKEQFLSTGGELRFSTDTLSFDTVFTTMGSATMAVKIYNPQSQKVTVSSVRMGRGNSSPFRLNVDGKPGEGTNVEIAANDSAYVFATVKVDPTDENSPFVVEDRLIATLNGAEYSIPVMAYGQNAYYIVNDTAINETVLKTDKPYVVIGYAVVAEGRTLRIPPKTRIYMHQNARLFVFGTLEAEGTKTDSIIFQGDRLDRAYYGYEGYPGEWGGIYFDSYSTNNKMKHVILRNCGRPTGGALAAAIQVAPYALSSGTQLTMDQCIVENSIGYGLASIGGNVVATNCLMHSCGANTLGVFQGGTYRFDNCTFATYGNTKISHTDNPVAVFFNYLDTSRTGWVLGNLDVLMRNCVIAGSLEDELFINTRSGATAKVNLQNCVVKANPDSLAKLIQDKILFPTSVRYNRPDGSFDPMFVDVGKWNFRLKQGSPLIDSGLDNINVTVDLDDRARTDGKVDIGAYEYF